MAMANFYSQITAQYFTILSRTYSNVRRIKIPGAGIIQQERDSFNKLDFFKL